MNELQAEFLRLHVVFQFSLDTISGKLNIPKATLSKWYEELREERSKIARIRNIWTRKKFTPDFCTFYDWLNSLERKCEYCGITEAQINHLLASGHLQTKRIQTRGRRLEFDRKTPELGYDNMDNIVLCCYWCNNAKTDTFTYEEFKQMGDVFASIWRKRLAL